MMEELRERTSELLLRLARRLKKEKAKRVFLVNNYDLICSIFAERDVSAHETDVLFWLNKLCLLYTSPSPRDATLSRMPSSA